MLSKFEREVIDKLPKEKKDFKGKQINAFDGWMKGDCFIPKNGFCYHCNFDIINHELNNGNNGDAGVTGCFKCNKSFCD